MTRVEPSLQAAFVDYGGNRHGFLAFSEIHPDYYQIPVADRQALIDEEGRAQRDAEDEDDRRSRRHRGRGRPAPARRDEEVVRGAVAERRRRRRLPPSSRRSSPRKTTGREIEPASDRPGRRVGSMGCDRAAIGERAGAASGANLRRAEPSRASPIRRRRKRPPDRTRIIPHQRRPRPPPKPAMTTTALRAAATARDGAENGDDDEAAEEVVELVGGADALEEVPDRAPRYRRQYKIQEVIKRRQVMLVQVVKEERGTKGAALTTYLSLAGRYSVLMPNTARGGGISRKITSPEDRSRLKEIAQELEVPEGMGVILRTAGASRTKTEIKRDFEYLLRLWETVRDLTLKSTAPKLVYEEGSLVKRSIRDLYSKDIDEVIGRRRRGLRRGQGIHAHAHAEPCASNVKLYTDTQPLLSRYGVENQLDAMFSPVVQLRSGGYIVLNQAEALVAIDVNSGRATREHHIEDTALKTNLEAADEIARQLRLRDLAGLIVIDFIDMDEKRNNRAVERRLKECLKQDRARIQVGRISHFGLLEMSRQRIRTSVLESSTDKCPYCGGSGHVRSVSSLALQVLRALEDQLMKSGTHNLIVRTRPDVALYVLNQKRAHLRALEERFVITITVSADETVTAPQAFVIDRGEQVHTVEAAKALAEQSAAAAPAAPLEEEDELEPAGIADDEEAEADAAEAAEGAPESGEGGPRRRRRRRRRGRNGGEAAAHEPTRRHEPIAEGAAQPFADRTTRRCPREISRQKAEETAADDRGGGAPQRDGERRRRRRGRRGGRRSRMEREHNGEPAHASHDHDAQAPQHEAATGAEFAAPPAYEPEVSEASADREHASPSRPREDAPHDESMPPSAPPAAPEPPRRRSTVREPAPGAAADETHAPQPKAPAEQPVITELGDSEPPDRPRRSGWWSRRFAGG